MTLTVPMLVTTWCSWSRQFSLADSLCLQTSRELWLLFRLITDSLFLSTLKLLDMLRLGMEMVSVRARLRRKNLCRAVFFSILIREKIELEPISKFEFEHCAAAASRDSADTVRDVGDDETVEILRDTDCQHRLLARNVSTQSRLLQRSANIRVTTTALTTPSRAVGAIFVLRRPTGFDQTLSSHLLSLFLCSPPSRGLFYVSQLL